MSSDLEKRINEALTLHRSGSVAEAKAAYGSILREDAHNANAMGLLGIVAIQEGERSRAEMLWSRSLTLVSSPAVFIRNLNNLVVTLLEEGRDSEAVALLERTDIPGWAGSTPPDERELKSIVSLILCLMRLGASKKARALLESISQHLAGDNDTLRLLARLRLDDQDFGPALEALKSIDAPADVWVLTARVGAAGEVGAREEIKSHRDELLKFASVYIAENFARERKTILVTNSGADRLVTDSLFELHFHKNYVGQIAARLKERFNFISVFADSPYVGKDALEPHLVLNNVVNGEVLSSVDGKALKEDLSGFVASFDVPVVNHPQRAAMATRQRNAASLKELEKIVVPRTIRFIAKESEIEFQIRALAGALKFPLIMRTTTSQKGYGMVKIDSEKDLRRELSTRNGQEIYAHQYIENRTRDGLFRKLRAAIVGDEIIPVRVDFSEFWMVHGRSAPERKDFYRQRRDLLDLEKRMLSIPNDTLSEDVISTLRDLRKKIPLDIFGIDFDVMLDGRVLFFEANATMLLLGYEDAEYQDVMHPADADARLEAAIARYLEKQMAP